ncbi:ABC transporter transmembrane domain-containing protein [Nocardiopsis coralliicola]
MSEPGPGAGRLMRRALVRNRGRLAVGILGTSGHQAAEALVPVAIGVIIDRAVATGDPGALLASLAGLALLFTVLTMSWRFGARSLVKAIELESHLLRIEASARAVHPRRAATGLRSGEVLTVATSDADKLARMLHFVPAALAYTVAMAVAAAVLIGIDPWLGGGVLVAVPLIVAAIQLAGPALTRRSTAQQAAVARTAGLAADLVRGLPALRGVGAEEAAAERYRISSARSLRASLHAALPAGVYHGATFAGGGLLLAGVAGFAGVAALEGRISVGELVTVVGLAQFLTEPVRTLGLCAMGLSVARASAGRLVRVLDAPFSLPETAQAGSAGPESAAAAPGAPSPSDSVRAQPSIRLAGVHHQTLAGLDLEVRPGELVGAVCLDAADARALDDLLAGRVHRPGAGTLDRPADLLAEPHDVDLFEGTVRSNVLAAHRASAAPAGSDAAGAGPDPGPALRAGAADDVVRGLPDGLDAPLTDRGTTLSGGQRQRIGLARALAADPPALVLNDPTTAVDAVTEEAVADGIRALRHGAGAADRATLVITASPALLARADRVVLIAGGCAAAEGTHAELAAARHDYAAAVLR